MLLMKVVASIELISGFIVPGAVLMPSTSSSRAKAGQAYAETAAVSDSRRRIISLHGRISAVARQLPPAYPLGMDQSDAPIRYMERTRLYYRALGYQNDYVWAHFADVPFTPLARPLSETRIGLVTTAGPPGGYPRDEKGLRHVWSGAIDSPPPRLATDVAWGRATTHN